MSETNEKGRRYHPFPRARRRPPAIDMLPYAGVAFILLSAFTLASEMSRPHVMDVYTTPNLIIPIAEDLENVHTLVLYVRDDGALFGRDGYGSSVRPVTLASVARMAEDGIRAKKDKMEFVVKAAPGASYASFIALLNQLHLADAATVEYLGEKRRGWGLRLHVLSMNHEEQQEIAL